MTLICKLVSINCLFYLQHSGPWPYIRLHCSSSFNLSEVAHKLTTRVTCCSYCRVHSWRGWVGTRDGPSKLPYLGIWDISVSSLRGACAELRDMVHLGIRVVHCWVCILLYAFFALPWNSSSVTVPRARWECWARQNSRAGDSLLGNFRSLLQQHYNSKSYYTFNPAFLSHIHSNSCRSGFLAWLYLYVCQ